VFKLDYIPTTKLAKSTSYINLSFRKKPIRKIPKIGRIGMGIIGVGNWWIYGGITDLRKKV